jgi:hypothetical protein
MWMRMGMVAVTIVVMVVVRVGGAVRIVAAPAVGVVAVGLAGARIGRLGHVATTERGWIQIDPTNLKDLSSKPLLDIAPAAVIPGRGAARRWLRELHGQRIARTRRHARS